MLKVNLVSIFNFYKACYGDLMFHLFLLFNGFLVIYKHILYDLYNWSMRQCKVIFSKH